MSPLNIRENNDEILACVKDYLNDVNLDSQSLMIAVLENEDLERLKKNNLEMVGQISTNLVQGIKLATSEDWQDKTLENIVKNTTKFDGR